MSSYSALHERIYGLLPIFLQNLIVTRHGRKRWGKETSNRFQQLVQKLREMQYANIEEISAYSRQRLSKVLRAASETDYYSSLLPSNSIIDKEPRKVLSDIPVLEREIVRTECQRFINREYKGNLIQHGTSGTTGTPLQTYWTKESMEWERALIWRHRLETGLDYANLWKGMLGGHRIVPLKQKSPPYWRINRSAKQLYFSTYHLSSATAIDYRRAMQEFGVRILEGYPSVLYALALSMERIDTSFPLEAVFFGAEPLLDFQRKTIEKVFQCYVWDYYGLTERVASATEYPCRKGLHENWENCFLEVVDADGIPVETGEYGELVGTSLNNLGFPLLRYRTGDMTRFIPDKCKCGRHSRRIEPVDTKREDLLVMPGGFLLSASNLTFPFKEVDNIIESQLYQKYPEYLEVRIIPSEEYSEEDGQKLLKGIRDMIPETVDVTLKKVKSIPRTKNGKFRFCVSEITHD